MPLTALARRFSLQLQSLRMVIAITVVAGVGVSSFIAYLEQASRVRDEHIAQIQLELKRLTELTALALREPLWQFVPLQANSIIEAAFVNPEVVSITVWDQDNLPFANRERKASAPDMVKTASRDIERDGLHVGKLIIQMSTAGYVGKVEAAQREYLRAGLQTSVGALLVILLLLHWRLVRPLERLIDGSQRIEKRQLDVPIDRIFDDEVGALADSLDATRQSLRDLVAELESRNLDLTDANSNLELRVKERTNSLQEALNSLERAQEEIIQAEKVASLGRIVAGFAHELNTPIGNALTVSSTLQEELLNLQKELVAGSIKRSTLDNYVNRGVEGFAIAMGNLQRSAALISDFKQVAVDQSSNQRREFDLSEVSRDILTLLHPTLSRAQCTVDADLAPELLCDGFPGRYGQVLTNLIVNAVTHAFEPGMQAHIHVQARAYDANYVELVVADNGIGMPEDVAARIFDPFFTTKMGRGGTGLGMNIVHGIVTQLLGGSISLRTAPGQGTELTLRFLRIAPAGPEQLS